MENVMLAIKQFMFMAMELAVFGVFGLVLAAGLYQIVRDKVLEARRRDHIAVGDELPAASGRPV